MFAARAATFALCLLPVASHALELVCKGTMYLHEGPVPHGEGAVSVEIHEEKGTLTLRGLMSGSGTGKLDAQPERLRAFIPLEHTFNGVRYPYVFVNIDRYSGQAVVIALMQPHLGERIKGLFSGACSPQARLF